MAQPKHDTSGDTLTRTRSARPPRHKVLVHNDDRTTMEFVVAVLERIFHHSPASAHRLMLTIHVEGVGVAGVYSQEIAETKAAQTTELARAQGYPLVVTTEPE